MNELITFRNELKSKYPPKYKFIGITSSIVLSFEIFKRNKEISNFVDTVFETQFKEYVMASRTTIVARLTRLIYDSDENEYLKFKKNLYNFIEILLNNRSLKNNTNTFDSWKF